MNNYNSPYAVYNRQTDRRRMRNCSKDCSPDFTDNCNLPDARDTADDYRRANCCCTNNCGCNENCCGTDNPPLIEKPPYTDDMSSSSAVVVPDKSKTKFPVNPSYAMAYVPFQNDMRVYEDMKALFTGTLFSALDKPFTMRCPK